MIQAIELLGWLLFSLAVLLGGIHQAMSLLATFGLAFGLGIDAFSVALASGVALGKVTPRQTFRLSFHFGLFQFGMPIIGWLIGSMVAGYVFDFSHWIAFGLLSFVGVRMIAGALTGKDDGMPRRDPTKGASLIVLSFATSIDALAVGLTLAIVGTPVLLPAIVIGLVAANMTLIGLQLGRVAGRILGSRMEVVGGLVLIAIGLKLLLEQLYG
jgi:manganese efflux pump family protein